MTLQTATDWQSISDELKEKVKKIGFNPDLNKMIKNIDSMVEHLSKLEVEARRTHKNTYIKPEVDKINQAIETVEQWLVMAILMR